MNLHINYKDLTCAILYDMFYLFLRMQIEDPWNVDTLEEFLYYCCPECKDERIQNKADFIKHALEEHPKSKVSVTKIIQVKKENSTKKQIHLLYLWSFLQHKMLQTAGNG